MRREPVPRGGGAGCGPVGGQGGRREGRPGRNPDIERECKLPEGETELPGRRFDRE